LHSLYKALSSLANIRKLSIDYERVQDVLLMHNRRLKRESEDVVGQGPFAGRFEANREQPIQRFGHEASFNVQSAALAP
jgi:hypothetical protein